MTKKGTCTVEPLSNFLLLLPQQAVPTARSDRISRDYAQEYPSIEIEGRRVVNKPQQNMDNVKLQEEVQSYNNVIQSLLTSSTKTVYICKTKTKTNMIFYDSFVC